MEVLHQGFNGMEWINHPAEWPAAAGKSVEAEGYGGSTAMADGGSTLFLNPPSKKDFWRKTYYTPVILKDDGPVLARRVPSTSTLSMQVTFELTPVRQFDQAGLFVRLSEEHWIKAGIEVVDGTPRLSCVVTNGHSDWSTQPWPEAAATIRLSQCGNGSYVFEALTAAAAAAAADGAAPSFAMARIAQLHGNAASAAGQEVQLGVFGCCPEAQEGCTIKFTNFSIAKGMAFEHNADGNLVAEKGAS